jgi:molecular chaperone GrpE
MSEEERDTRDETPPAAGDAPIESPAETPGTGTGEAAPPVAADEAVATVARVELDSLRQKAEERDRFFRDLQRTVADFDNYQKRVRRDRPLWEAERIRRFLLDFLPAVDDIERLQSALAGGLSAADARRAVGLLGDKVAKVLADWKIEPIATAGVPFDPAFHDAIRQEETAAVAPGGILEELRKGYTMGGMVIRASQVVVARAPARTGEESTGDGEAENTAAGEADGGKSAEKPGGDEESI